MRPLLLLPLLLLAAPAFAVEREEVGATTDSVVDDILTGAWLDPEDPFWIPHRGERFELSVLLGGEGALGSFAPDKIPTIGGATINVLGRYYPVDRIGVVFGTRAYFGLDDVPAAGTTASSVVSGITGVRYDLVRENRFSLLWDMYSGPSLYVFTGIVDAVGGALTAATPNISLGGEMGTALAMRYSLGPLTGEVRGFVGGRAGASASPFQRSGYDGGSGPFSSLYAGLDLGGTWSL